MKTTSLFILLFCFLLACREKPKSVDAPSVIPSISTNSYNTPSTRSSSSSSSDRSNSYSDYEDGTYNASVRYYNPNTGTTSSYNLDVDVEDGQVVKIYFPNGGWLDNSHFTPAAIDSDGTASFTSDKGYQYEIEIENQGSSYIQDSYQDDDDHEDNENVDDNEEDNDENGD